jgi:hypothetical protein
MKSYPIIIICVISVPLKCNRTQIMLIRQINADELRESRITKKRQRGCKEKIL